MSVYMFCKIAELVPPNVIAIYVYLTFSVKKATLLLITKI